MALRDIIPVRRNRTLAARGRDLDPFTLLQTRIDNLLRDFEEDFSGGFGSLTDVVGRTAVARTDVTESDGEIEITTELPGVDPKNVDVQLSPDRIVIRGEKLGQREEKEGKDRVITERSYGKFERVIPLPEGVNADGVKADFKNGVLTVTLPKTQTAKHETRSIPVSAR